MSLLRKLMDSEKSYPTFNAVRVDNGAELNNINIEYAKELDSKIYFFDKVVLRKRDDAHYPDTVDELQS